MDRIVSVIGAVRKLKSEQKLSLKTPLASLTIYGLSEKEHALFAAQESLIKGITHTASIMHGEKNGTTELHMSENVWHATVTLDQGKVS